MTKQECAYALQVLQQKRSMVQVVGPATDRPELARWQLEALDAVVAYLTRPRFSINPFV
jgi:hypothetical protein